MQYYLAFKSWVIRCDECGHIQHRDINAVCNIRDWGFQEVVGRKPGVEYTRVDVVWDILSSDMISCSQLKQEAVALTRR